MYCINCGTEIVPEARFCNKCGTIVDVTKEIEDSISPVRHHSSQKPSKNFFQKLAAGVLGKNSWGFKTRSIQIAWVAVIVFLVISTYTGQGTTNSKEANKDSTKSSSATFDANKAQQVTATEAYDEYEANKLAAGDKYANSPTVISGVLYDVKEETYRNGKQVKLSFKHDKNMFNHVGANLIESSEQRSIALKLAKGDFIRVGCLGAEKVIGGATFNRCVIVEAPGLTAGSGSEPAIKVDGLSLALDYSRSGQEVNRYVGKLVETEMFVEKFETNGSTKRLIDANSGFFCDIDSSQIASFPTNRGTYYVKGILVAADQRVGLSRCQYISSR